MKRRKSKLKKTRHNTAFFKPGEAKSLEQFLIASMIQGGFTAIGAVLGTVLAKYLLQELEKNVPLPQALYGVIHKETQ